MSERTRAYLPTLDGWRAIAILSVIFYHDALHTHIINTRWLHEYGDLGVDVFFAISGLLICSRLLDEERIHGKIDVRGFYVRRGFRILPPVFLYLGVISILAAFSVTPITKAELPSELAGCLLFFRNIHLTKYFLGANAPGGWYTGHFWSLSLEEQFYLLLPAFLVLMARRFRVHTLGVLAVAVALHRALAMAACPGGWAIKLHPDVRIDALLVPAMIAILASSPQNRLAFQRYLRFWPLGVIVFLCLVPFGHGTAWGLTVFIWLLPTIVLGSVLNPANVFGRLLEWSVLRYVGRISYSLYLWQQLFFTDHFFWQNTYPLGWLQSWPLRLVLTFGLAAASYHLLERPLIRLGYKLAPSATAGRNNADAADSECSLPLVIDSFNASQESKVTV
jgi:peptidoglycan/LPS O-acetylase OafA/YrhL